VKKYRTPHVTQEEARRRRRWWLVDADGQTLGRLATAIARVLMGKHLPTYSPHNDDADFVVVVNAGKVALSGAKERQKEYNWYTGYPGGLKKRSAAEMREKAPERMITLAVRRMLPKNTLARRQLRRLKVYAGAEHPHAAQRPESVDIFALAYGG